MSTHPLALTRGVSRAQIEYIVDHAEATLALGNGPTMILILGTTEHGERIELTGVMRDEDVLWVHARPAIDDYAPLFALAHDQAAAMPQLDDEADGGAYGVSVDAMALTEPLIDELIVAARDGHDIDTLRLRLRPGRPAPLSVGVQVRVTLSPALSVASSERADADGIALPELARRALRHHLQANPTV